MTPRHDGAEGLVMQISRDGIWVSPDIPVDNCAQQVLSALSPMMQHFISDEAAILAQAEVERLTTERDEARAEVRRLIAERDQPESRPKGREVGRFGLDGHYLDYEALKPTRPSDEDIWREAFMTLLPSYPWEKAAKQSDGVLAEYRKRWPR